MRTLLATTCLSVMIAASAQATEAPECAKVRMSDLGWTDIMLTNTTAEVILEAIGYEVEQTLLGLDVTFVSMQSGEIDVFQGNWRPIQDEQYKSYFDDGSVEVIGTNLEGAKFTLAVPDYVAAGGVASYDDLAAHADKFDSSIYGIEPGSNQPLLDMVAAGNHGLAGWHVVESSEAGMLAQVEKSVEAQDWIVFLAWEPHPMNLDYKLTYLAGGDAEYGPNFGGATVRTISRKGYAAQCPNVTKFFQNLVFDLDYENHGMQKILGEGKSPDEAAREMLAQDPSRLDKWLEGVTTVSGEPALEAAMAGLGL